MPTLSWAIILREKGDSMIYTITLTPAEVTAVRRVIGSVHDAGGDFGICYKTVVNNRGQKVAVLTEKIGHTTVTYNKDGSVYVHADCPPALFVDVMDLLRDITVASIPLIGATKKYIKALTPKVERFERRWFPREGETNNNDKRI